MPSIAQTQQEAVIARLIDLGQELAELIVEEVRTKQVSATKAGPVFDRVSRGIRRGILLARKLAEPANARAAARITARKRIIRAVEDTIQRETEGPEARDLHQELLDRLDTPDLEDELGDRPVADIITDILRDFGLAALPGTHPWKRRSPADIAELRAQAEQSAEQPAEQPAEPRPSAPPAPSAAHPPIPWRTTPEPPPYHPLE